MPLNENAPFHPYSPYAVAKLYGFWIVKEYREAYNMFCCRAVFSSTTNPNVGVELTSPARSPLPPPTSSRACKIACNWATLAPRWTGAMPRTMQSACGSSCRTTVPRMSSSLPACSAPPARDLANLRDIKDKTDYRLVKMDICDYEGV